LHVAGLSLCVYQWLVACRGCGCSGVWLGLVIKGSGTDFKNVKCCCGLWCSKQ
jgi:hypothetical protein